MNKLGIIFNIQHFSIVDGPGIRTTVFLKGCNLRCQWCHNPESLSVKKELVFYEDKCIGCGNCVKVCENNAHVFFPNHEHVFQREKCVDCRQCAEVCYSNALMTVGEEMSVDELFQNIMEDELYYHNSNGGVTFSGGECMIQKGFLTEILKRCKEAKIHTAVDTAGNIDFTDFLQVLPYTDLFLYDIKAFHPEVHKNLTTVGNERILANFEKLIQKKAHIIVRVPFIPGVNDMEMQAIAEYLSKFKDIPVEILGYHNMGESKYKALGKEDNKNYKNNVPSMEDVAFVETMFESFGIPILKNKQ